MFGRDPRLPLTETFKPRMRYLGTEDTVLSLEALKNMYLLVAENLKKARERVLPSNNPRMKTILPNQLVTLKVYLKKTLDPRYEGTYRVISVKGNQVEIAKSGTLLPTKWVHVSHLKPLLRADDIIDQLPTPDKFARKHKTSFRPCKKFQILNGIELIF